MPQTLLLADDSVTIQRVIELTFADEDIRVVAVSDGDQAIASIEASPPDIVLADIGMPGKNGYEVAQYIRRSPRLAHIPVILLTGAFEPVDEQRAADAGCDGVLAKPFEPQLVIGRVKELLSQPRPPRSAQASMPSTPAAAPPEGDGTLAPPARPVSQAKAELDDYFDRLDAAFATLSNAPGQRPEPRTSTTSRPQPDAADWIGTTNAADAPDTDHWDVLASDTNDVADLPLAYQPPPAPAAEDRAPAAEDARPEPVERPAAVAEIPAAAARVAPPSVSAPLAVVTFPPIADAFAALLAAEQDTIDPAVMPTWPTPAPAQPAVTDELVEEVVRRVIERLSGRVVSDAVEATVLPVAERLIREEIERIKSSIK